MPERAQSNLSGISVRLKILRRISEDETARHRYSQTSKASRNLAGKQNPLGCGIAPREIRILKRLAERKLGVEAPFYTRDLDGIVTFFVVSSSIILTYLGRTAIPKGLSSSTGPDPTH
jgi:hypothetical protein